LLGMSQEIQSSSHFDELLFFVWLNNKFSSENTPTTPKGILKKSTSTNTLAQETVWQKLSSLVNSALHNKKTVTFDLERNRAIVLEPTERTSFGEITPPTDPLHTDIFMYFSSPEGRKRCLEKFQRDQKTLRRKQELLYFHKGHYAQAAQQKILDIDQQISETKKLAHMFEQKILQGEESAAARVESRIRQMLHQKYQGLNLQSDEDFSQSLATARGYLAVSDRDPWSFETATLALYDLVDLVAEEIATNQNQTTIRLGQEYQGFDQGLFAGSDQDALDLIADHLEAPGSAAPTMSVIVLSQDRVSSQWDGQMRLGS